MLILASASPRRAELLQQIGVTFEVIPANIDERMQRNEAPGNYVRRLSQEKATAVQSILSASQACKNSLNDAPAIVMGADTVVVFNGRVFGKPNDFSAFEDTMNQLSGNRHQVISAATLVSAQFTETVFSSTNVYFRDLTEEDIASYWRTGEPADKAGGYAIQGLAASFIRRIEGSYSGVVGLPLFEVCDMLNRAGVQLDVGNAHR